MRKFYRSLYTRPLSVFVMAAFLVTQGPVFLLAETLQNPVLKVNDISIPEKLGRVEEVYKTPECRIPGSPHCSGKQIIFIQDAHSSLEAQENIGKMIAHLTEQSDVRTVYQEGYEGPVPTDSFFAFIENPEIRRKVSYFFLDKLRIGGAEYAHINRKKDFRLIGADSIKLHHKNIRQYQISARYQEEIREDLKLLFNEVNALGARFFPQEIKDFLKLRERYDKNEIELTDYLNRVKTLAGKTEFKAKAGTYPFIELILAARKSNDPDLVRQLQDMDPRELFSEIARYENDFSLVLLKTDKERKIYTHLKELLLIKRLNDLEVTPQEHDSVKETLSKVSTLELARWISGEINKTVVVSKAWELSILHALKFYDLAEERDRFIEKSLEGFLVSKNEQEAVLVFGGFHKRNIETFLRRNSISYAVVSPHISGDDPVHQKYYKLLMTVGSHPYELPAELAKAARPESLLTLPGARSEIRNVYAMAVKYPDLEFPIFDKHVLSSFRTAGTGRLPEIPLMPAQKQRSELRTVETVREYFKENKIPAELQGIFTAEILGALLADPAMEPVFLVDMAAADKGSQAGAMDYVNNELLQKIGGVERLKKFTGFTIGDTEQALQAFNQGVPLIVGLRDRHDDKRNFKFAVANERQVYFPLGDGLWLGVKGSGLSGGGESNFYYKREKNKWWGLVSHQEGERAAQWAIALEKEGRADLLTLPGGPAVQTLAIQRILAIPVIKSGKFSFTPVSQGFDIQSMDYGWEQVMVPVVYTLPVRLLNGITESSTDISPFPRLVFNLFTGSPHRLEKFFQILETDHGFARTRAEISKALAKTGELEAGTVLSESEWMARVIKNLGQDEGVRGMRYDLATMQAQDFTLSGQRADNEEIIKIFPEQDFPGADLSNFKGHAMHGIQIKLRIILSIMARLDGQMKTYFPRPQETLNVFFENYFSELPVKELELWALEPSAGTKKPRPLESLDHLARLDLFHSSADWKRVHEGDFSAEEKKAFSRPDGKFFDRAKHDAMIQEIRGLAVKFLSKRRSEARAADSSAAARLKNDFGVSLSEQDGRYYVSQPELKETSWTMNETRAAEKKPVVTNVNELPLLELAYPFEELPLFAKAGTSSRGVYLGFVKGIEHPVVIKMLLDGWAQSVDTNEMVLAQIFSHLGVGPRFFGRVLINGESGYVMQAVAGEELESSEYSTLGSNTDAREIRNRTSSAGLSWAALTRTPSGRLIAIDVGNAFVLNQEAFDAYLREANSQARSELRESDSDVFQDTAGKWIEEGSGKITVTADDKSAFNFVFERDQDPISEASRFVITVFYKSKEIGYVHAKFFEEGKVFLLDVAFDEGVLARKRIEAIYVKPELRKKYSGIGRSLMGLLMRLARSVDAREMIIQNAAAEDFYHSLGFEISPAGEINDYIFEFPEDASAAGMPKVSIFKRSELRAANRIKPEPASWGARITAWKIRKAAIDGRIKLGNLEKDQLREISKGRRVSREMSGLLLDLLEKSGADKLRNIEFEELKNYLLNVSAGLELYVTVPAHLRNVQNIQIGFGDADMEWVVPSAAESSQADAEDAYGNGFLQLPFLTRTFEGAVRDSASGLPVPPISQIQSIQTAHVQEGRTEGIFSADFEVTEPLYQGEQRPRAIFSVSRAEQFNDVLEKSFLNMRRLGQISSLYVPQVFASARGVLGRREDGSTRYLSMYSMQRLYGFTEINNNLHNGMILINGYPNRFSEDLSPADTALVKKEMIRIVTLYFERSKQIYGRRLMLGYIHRETKEFTGGPNVQAGDFMLDPRRLPEGKDFLRLITARELREKSIPEFIHLLLEAPSQPRMPQKQFSAENILQGIQSALVEIYGEKRGRELTDAWLSEYEAVYQAPEFFMRSELRSADETQIVNDLREYVELSPEQAIGGANYSERPVVKEIPISGGRIVRNLLITTKERGTPYVTLPEKSEDLAATHEAYDCCALILKQPAQDGGLIRVGHAPFGIARSGRDASLGTVKKGKKMFVTRFLQDLPKAKVPEELIIFERQDDDGDQWVKELAAEIAPRKILYIERPKASVSAVAAGPKGAAVFSIPYYLRGPRTDRKLVTFRSGRSAQIISWDTLHQIFDTAGSNLVIIKSGETAPGFSVPAETLAGWNVKLRDDYFSAENFRLAPNAEDLLEGPIYDLKLMEGALQHGPREFIFKILPVVFRAAGLSEDGAEAFVQSFPKLSTSLEKNTALDGLLEPLWQSEGSFQRMAATILFKLRSEARVLNPGDIVKGENKSYLIGRQRHSGIADLFEAEEIGSGRKALIKYYSNSTANPSFDKGRAFYAQEAAALKELKGGKYYPELYDQGQYSGGEWTAVERIEGTDLDEWLFSSHSDEERMAVMDRIFEAVEDLHARGIVHHDLKPANFMITPDSKIKIVDFEGAFHEEEDGTPSMTFFYAPGELQYKVRENVKAQKASDLFSLALIFIEIANGTLVNDIGHKSAAHWLRQDDANASLFQEQLPPQWKKFIPVIKPVLKNAPKDRNTSVTEMRRIFNSLRSEARATGEPTALLDRILEDQKLWFDSLTTEEQQGEGLGAKIYADLRQVITSIDQKIAEGKIRPYVSLKLNKLSPDTVNSELLPPEEGRRVRAGVLTVTGNPLTWGHILIALHSMEALNLDTVIFIVQGIVTYKGVEPKDQIPIEAREKMVKGALGKFAPLLRYSDISSDTSRIGEDSWHQLRDLNPDTDIDFVYLAGSEETAGVVRILNNLKMYAEKHSLSGLRHRMEAGFFQTEKSFTQDEMNKILREVEMPGRASVVKVPHLLTDQISSTRYRAYFDASIVPKEVHDMVIARGFYRSETRALSSGEIVTGKKHSYRILRLKQSWIADLFEAEEIGSGRRSFIKFYSRRKPEAIGQETAVLRKVEDGKFYPALYDQGSYGGGEWFAMENIEGKNINEWLSDPRSLEERLRVMDLIFEAVEDLHARGIVHHDLKSSNFMITPDNKIKIIDFEGAFYEGAYGLPSMTPSYASPEIFFRDGVEVNAQKASDLFSLGILLIEMLKGSSVLDIESRNAAMWLRRGDENARHFTGQLPADLKKFEPVAAGVLKYDAADRIPSVTEMRRIFNSIRSEVRTESSEALADQILNMKRSELRTDNEAYQLSSPEDFGEEILKMMDIHLANAEKDESLSELARESAKQAGKQLVSVEAKYIAPFFQRRAAALGMTLEQYHDFWGLILDARDFKGGEYKFYGKIFDFTASRLELTYPMANFDKGAVVSSAVKNRVVNRLNSEGPVKPIVFRFAALGDGGELSVVSKMLNEILKEILADPAYQDFLTKNKIPDTAALARYLKLEFNFYDIRNWKLTGLEKQMEDLRAVYPWLPEKPVYEFANLTVPQMYENWEKDSTSFMIARNLFSAMSDVLTFAEKVSSTLEEGGVYIVNPNDASLIIWKEDSIKLRALDSYPAAHDDYHVRVFSPVPRSEVRAADSGSLFSLQGEPKILMDEPEGLLQFKIRVEKSTRLGDLYRALGTYLDQQKDFLLAGGEIRHLRHAAGGEIAVPPSNGFNRTMVFKAGSELYVEITFRISNAMAFSRDIEKIETAKHLIAGFRSRLGEQRAGRTLVDLGSGKGDLLRQLLPLFPNVYAVERDRQSVLALRRTLGKAVTITAADFFQGVPDLFPDGGKADVILSSHSFYSPDLSNRIRAITESFNLFKSSGANHFVFVINDLDHPDPYSRTLMREKIMGRQVTNPESLWSIESFMKAAGFEVEDEYFSSEHIETSPDRMFILALSMLPVEERENPVKRKELMKYVQAEYPEGLKIPGENRYRIVNQQKIIWASRQTERPLPDVTQLVTFPVEGGRQALVKLEDGERPVYALINMLEKKTGFGYAAQVFYPGNGYFLYDSNGEGHRSGRVKRFNGILRLTLEKNDSPLNLQLQAVPAHGSAFQVLLHSSEPLWIRPADELLKKLKVEDKEQHLFPAEEIPSRFRFSNPSLTMLESITDPLDKWVLNEVSGRYTYSKRSELRTVDPWTAPVREVRINEDHSAATVVFEDGKTVELTEKIEKEGFSEFFMYRENGRRLLLKAVKPGLNPRDRGRAAYSLENEARISRLLRRAKKMENVTHIIWNGEVEGAEQGILISGPDAETLKVWRERLTLQERAGIFRQYVEQIWKAYSGPERGSIALHDLKPSNALLETGKDQDGRPVYKVHVIDLEAAKRARDVDFDDIWRDTLPYLPDAEMIVMLMDILGRHKALGLVSFMELLIFFQDFVLDDSAMNSGTKNVERFIAPESRAALKAIVKKISGHEKYRKIWHYDNVSEDPIDLEGLFNGLIEDLEKMEALKERRILFPERILNRVMGIISALIKKAMDFFSRRTGLYDDQPAKLPAQRIVDDLFSDALTPMAEGDGETAVSQFQKLMYLQETLGRNFSERDFIRSGNRTVRELSSLYLLNRGMDAADRGELSIYNEAEEDVRRVYSRLSRPLDDYVEDAIRHVRTSILRQRSELRANDGDTPETKSPIDWKIIFKEAGVTDLVKGRPTKDGIFLATPDIIFEQALKAASSIIESPNAIIDAGSGQGQNLVRFARAYPQSQVFGIESDPVLAADSQKLIDAAQRLGVTKSDQKVEIKTGDFNSPESGQIFENADLVYYFSAGTNSHAEFVKTLISRLKPGALVAEAGLVRQLNLETAAPESFERVKVPGPAYLTFYRKRSDLKQAARSESRVNLRDEVLNALPEDERTRIDTAVRFIIHMKELLRVLPSMTPAAAKSADRLTFEAIPADVIYEWVKELLDEDEFAFINDQWQAEAFYFLSKKHPDFKNIKWSFQLMSRVYSELEKRSVPASQFSSLTVFMDAIWKNFESSEPQRLSLRERMISVIAGMEENIALRQQVGFVMEFLDRMALYAEAGSGRRGELAREFLRIFTERLFESQAMELTFNFNRSLVEGVLTPSPNAPNAGLVYIFSGSTPLYDQAIRIAENLRLDTDKIHALTVNRAIELGDREMLREYLVQELFTEGKSKYEVLYLMDTGFHGTMLTLTADVLATIPNAPKILHGRMLYLNREPYNHRPPASSAEKTQLSLDVLGWNHVMAELGMFPSYKYEAALLYMVHVLDVALPRQKKSPVSLERSPGSGKIEPQAADTDVPVFASIARQELSAGLDLYLSDPAIRYPDLGNAAWNSWLDEAALKNLKRSEVRALSFETVKAALLDPDVRVFQGLVTRASLSELDHYVLNLNFNRAILEDRSFLQALREKIEMVKLAEHDFYVRHHLMINDILRNLVPEAYDRGNLNGRKVYYSTDESGQIDRRLLWSETLVPMIQLPKNQSVQNWMHELLFQEDGKFLLETIQKVLGDTSITLSDLKGPLLMAPVQAGEYQRVFTAAVEIEGGRSASFAVLISYDESRVDTVRDEFNNSQALQQTMTLPRTLAFSESPRAAAYSAGFMDGLGEVIFFRPEDYLALPLRFWPNFPKEKKPPFGLFILNSIHSLWGGAFAEEDTRTILRESLKEPVKVYLKTGKKIMGISFSRGDFQLMKSFRIPGGESSDIKGRVSRGMSFSFIAPRDLRAVSSEKFLDDLFALSYLLYDERPVSEADIVPQNIPDGILDAVVMAAVESFGIENGLEKAGELLSGYDFETAARKRKPGFQVFTRKKIASYLKALPGQTFYRRSELRASSAGVLLEPSDSPVDWKEIFGNNNPIEVNVGVAGGAELWQTARKFPGINFVGFETDDWANRRFLERIPDAPLNAKVVLEDARKGIEKMFKDGELSRINLVFFPPYSMGYLKPDLAAMQNKLKPGGSIVLITEEADFAGQFAEYFKGQPGFSVSEEPYRLQDAGQTPQKEMVLGSEFRKMFAAKTLFQVAAVKSDTPEEVSGIDARSEVRTLKDNLGLKALENITMKVISSDEEIVSVSHEFSEPGDSSEGITPSADNPLMPSVLSAWKYFFRRTAVPSEIATPLDFSGSDVLLIGPSRGGADLAEFIKKFPTVREIHIADVDDRVFWGNNTELQALKKAGVPLPKVYGYKVNALKLPDELSSKMDAVFHLGVVDSGYFSAGQRTEFGRQVVKVLKPGGIAISMPFVRRDIHEGDDRVILYPPESEGKAMLVHIKKGHSRSELRNIRDLLETHKEKIAGQSQRKAAVILGISRDRVNAHFRKFPGDLIKYKIKTSLYEWKTRSESVQNIRKAFKRFKPSISKRYSELETLSPDEVKQLKEDIYSIQRGDFLLWGLTSAINSVNITFFERSHIKALQAVFPDLELDPLGFQLVWDTAENRMKSIQYVFEKEIPGLVARYKKMQPGDEKERTALRKEFYKLGAAHINAWSLQRPLKAAAAPEFEGHYYQLFIKAFPDLNLSPLGFRLDFTDREKALSSVRFVISQEMPELIRMYETISELGPNEIRILNDSILSITPAHFKVWKIGGIFNSKKVPYFGGSHTEVLRALFTDPRLNLTDNDFQSFNQGSNEAQYKWKGTAETGIANVRTAFSIYRPDILERYSRVEQLTPQEFKELQEEIYLITTGHFNVWGINKAGSQNYFGKTYKQALIQTFPKLNLNILGFGFDWSSPASRVESVQYAMAQNRPDFFARYQALDHLTPPAEIERLRNEIYEIRQAHLRMWGLSGALEKKMAPEFKGEFTFVLIKSFPKLALDPLGFVLDYSTEERANASVRFAIGRQLPDLLEQYGRIESLNEQELASLRNRIYGLTLVHFRAWGLNHALDRKSVPFYKSNYIKALMMAFNHPRLGLTSRGFVESTLERASLFSAKEIQGSANEAAADTSLDQFRLQLKQADSNKAQLETLIGKEQFEDALNIFGETNRILDTAWDLADKQEDPAQKKIWAAEVERLYSELESITANLSAYVSTAYADAEEDDEESLARAEVRAVDSLKDIFDTEISSAVDFGTGDGSWMVSVQQRPVTWLSKDAEVTGVENQVPVYYPEYGGSLGIIEEDWEEFVTARRKRYGLRVVTKESDAPVFAADKPAVLHAAFLPPEAQEDRHFGRLLNQLPAGGWVIIANTKSISRPEDWNQLLLAHGVELEDIRLFNTETGFPADYPKTFWWKYFPVKDNFLIVAQKKTRTDETAAKTARSELRSDIASVSSAEFDEKVLKKEPYFTDWIGHELNFLTMRTLMRTYPESWWNQPNTDFLSEGLAKESKFSRHKEQYEDFELDLERRIAAGQKEFEVHVYGPGFWQEPVELYLRAQRAFKKSGESVESLKLRIFIFDQADQHKVAQKAMAGEIYYDPEDVLELKNSGFNTGEIFTREKQGLRFVPDPNIFTAVDVNLRDLNDFARASVQKRADYIFMNQIYGYLTRDHESEDYGMVLWNKLYEVLKPGAVFYMGNFTMVESMAPPVYRQKVRDHDNGLLNEREWKIGRYDKPRSEMRTESKLGNEEDTISISGSPLQITPLTSRIMEAHGGRIIDLVHQYPGNNLFTVERDILAEGRLKFDESLSLAAVDGSENLQGFLLAYPVVPSQLQTKMPGAKMGAEKSFYLSKWRVEADKKKTALPFYLLLSVLRKAQKTGYRSAYWRISDLPESQMPLNQYRKWVRIGVAEELGRFGPDLGADIADVNHIGFKIQLDVFVPYLERIVERISRSEMRKDGLVKLNVRRILKDSKVPALVYLDYKNLMEKFWDAENKTWNEQGAEIIKLASIHAEKIRLVIYGADITDERLKPFRELRESRRNVRITDDAAAEAYAVTQKDFVKGLKKYVNIHLSKDFSGVKNSFTGTAKDEMYFFRYETGDQSSGLLAAALLWADYEEAGKKMDGFTRDGEGFLVLSESYLRAIVQKYEASLVVAFSA